MLISLLILVVVAILAYWIITQFFPEPARMIALLITGVILLFWLLNILGVVSSSIPSTLIK
jgi:hypothetical protein